MPETFMGWVMFAFFTGGALGGWTLLYLFAKEWIEAKF